MTAIHPELKNIPYDFRATLERNDLCIAPIAIETLQANITRTCNQACRHCHVGASPQETTEMDARTVDRCLEILSDEPRIRSLDLTGGAPELHPLFERFVEGARRVQKHVIVRHNLTVTFDGHPKTGASMEHLPAYFAEQEVEVVSSLPYYQEYFTDRQRGPGVFEKSIRALKRLNEAGYGKPGTGKVLNLVYNPAGAYLPASQESLEADFKKALSARFGVTFNNLYTIINMPIFRFRHLLQQLGTLEAYWEKLVSAFNPCAAQSVMCRNQVSVGWDGRLYDCDFNMVLDMPVHTGEPMTVFNFDYEALLRREILVAPHCFGCTAGGGSSCGGALA